MTSKLHHYGRPQTNTRRKLNRWRSKNPLVQWWQRARVHDEAFGDSSRRIDRAMEGIDG